MSKATTGKSVEEIETEKTSPKKPRQRTAILNDVKKTRTATVTLDKVYDEIPQPAEVVLGRYYEITYPDGGRVVGRLVGVEGDLQSICPWKAGKPTHEPIKTFFRNRPVREIDRETCHDLSMVDSL